MEKQVTVYSTPTCPFCIRAKQYLKESGIKFTEYDVGADQDKAKEMIEKSGQMGVPVIEIDENIIIGFDKEKNRPAASSADWNYRPPMVTGAVEFDTICDECEFFDDENNWCDANNRDTRFDSRACTSFERKRAKEGCGCKQ